jgi:hypothetical protein
MNSGIFIIMTLFKTLKPIKIEKYLFKSQNSTFKLLTFLSLDLKIFIRILLDLKFKTPVFRNTLRLVGGLLRCKSNMKCVLYIA